MEDVRQNIQQFIPMARENYSNRETRVRELDEQAALRTKELETIKASREVQMIVAPRIEAQKDLMGVCMNAERFAHGKDSIETAGAIVEKVLDLVDWVIWIRDFADLRGRGFPIESNQAEENSGEVEGNSDGEKSKENVLTLPQLLWSDAVHNFLSDLPMPPPIPSSVVINPSEELPDKLTYKPTFSQKNWLYKQPFTAKEVLAFGAVHPLDEASITMLAEADKNKFIRMVSKEVTEDIETLKVRCGVECVEEDASVTMVPPDWLVASPPDYLLGEALIAVRCTINPVPNDPEPRMLVPDNILRLALCGLSQTCRQAVSFELTRSFGVEVIVVESLLHSAIEVGARQKSINNLSEYETLCSNIYLAVCQGELISDKFYVELIYAHLQELLTENKIDAFKGFVIEDFPRTRHQAQLLLQILSGIDYASKKPHATDNASLWANPIPCIPEVYDVSKCGLDGVVFLDSDLEKVIEEKVRARKNLQTGEVVYIEDTCTDVSTFAEIYQPLNQPLVAGADLKHSADCMGGLRTFLSGLNLLKEIPISGRDSDDSSVANTVSKCVREWYGEKGKPSMQKTTEVIDVDTPIEVVVNDSGDDQVESAEKGVESEEKGGDGEEVDQTTETSPDETLAPIEPNDSKSAHMRASIPLQLAQALDRIWSTCEQASSEVVTEAFNGLRNIRYQMIQRCRSCTDALNGMIIRKDDKQGVFEAFRGDFNAVDSDLRFDEDVIAELHLRVLELRVALQNITDERKQELIELVKNIEKDGIVLALSHRVRCEFAAILQSELNRFTASCHLILDTSKCLCKRNFIVTHSTELEETLGTDAHVTVADAGGKDKKGKGTTEGPYRLPITTSMLDAELLQAIPKVEEEVEEDPKSKVLY